MAKKRKVSKTRKSSSRTVSRSASRSASGNFMGIKYDSLTFLLFLLFVLVVALYFVSRAMGMGV